MIWEYKAKLLWECVVFVHRHKNMLIPPAHCKWWGGILDSLCPLSVRPSVDILCFCANFIQWFTIQKFCVSVQTVYIYITTLHTLLLLLCIFIITLYCIEAAILNSSMEAAMLFSFLYIILATVFCI